MSGDTSRRPPYISPPYGAKERESVCVCVCVCVRACVRACVRTCVCVQTFLTYTA